MEENVIFILFNMNHISNTHDKKEEFIRDDLTPTASLLLRSGVHHWVFLY